MDLSADFFKLFGLTPGFRLSLSELDSRYRDVQAQVHPDRFINAGDAERRLSMQWATRANEAYLTLKKPLERARYLLELAGCDLQAESNTAFMARQQDSVSQHRKTFQRRLIRRQFTQLRKCCVSPRKSAG